MKTPLQMGIMVSTLPFATKTAGSQNPTDTCTPSSCANARSGKAMWRTQFPQAEPKSAFRNNMGMLAHVARQPFGISAPSFAVSAARSEEIRTLKSKSPLDAAVPED
eukprot:3809070-Heterocapsa_arctica.AAC.1